MTRVSQLSFVGPFQLASLLVIRDPAESGFSQASLGIPLGT